jgi:alpha-tubulin suppressor-like RCC1 family protein
VNEPAVVEMFKETVVEFCACGDEYSAVINETGELFTFGSHAKGRLGLGPVDEEGHQLIPLKIEVEGFPHNKSICCGANHVLAIPDYDSEDDSADKGLWSWGLSTRGQLGHGNKETLYSPKLIQKVMTERFRKVVCGLEHSMGLTDQGTLYYWGAHEYLLRSDYGNTKDKDEPIIMQASTTEKIIDIAACHHYNLAIALGSDVIYWGEFFKENTESKGKGGSKSIVIESKLGIKAKQIACGPNHAAAIKFNDCMYTWGNDSDGALGYRAPKGKPVTNPEIAIFYYQFY